MVEFRVDVDVRRTAVCPGTCACAQAHMHAQHPHGRGRIFHLCKPVLNLYAASPNAFFRTSLLLLCAPESTARSDMPITAADVKCARVRVRPSRVGFECAKYGDLYQENFGATRCSECPLNTFRPTQNGLIVNRTACQCKEGTRCCGCRAEAPRAHSSCSFFFFFSSPAAVAATNT